MTTTFTTERPEVRSYYDKFLRHVIGLAFTYRVGGSEYFGVRTCFFMAVESCTLLVTAGHVAEEEIKRLLEWSKEGQIEGLKFALLDGHTLAAKTKDPVAFDLQTVEAAIFENKDGLDFMVMPLSMYYVKLLAANGLKPLTELHWDSDLRPNLGYYLCGWRTELVKGTPSTGVTDTELIVIGVERINSKPASLTDAYPAGTFYGRIGLGKSLNSICGMSGGPVFGIHETEEKVEYFLSGIQSAWDGKEYIAATPAREVGRYMREQFEKWRLTPSFKREE